ncbi:GNAT family N-acetyltransferase [Muricoccus vinaceus]|uniref:GNAT family N-acetyltransferase n=1 Tax=Muricoccus vinaceus TaxID=424704 RepID=A0ABV6J0M3_9PROT
MAAPVVQCGKRRGLSRTAAPGSIAAMSGTPPPPSPSGPPLGPEVDPTPRPLPARVPHRGASVTLEPLHADHSAELWAATQAPGAEAGWAYMGYGPFADEAAMRRHVAAFAAQHDPLAWAVRPGLTGTADGWLTLMEIAPADSAIEIGNIWFSPRMQRTRAATEAMFLLMRHAMDELGYRRLVWKCHALNAPSRAAAARLGFRYEGTLRAIKVIKGRLRDTAQFSILDDEWPARRDAIAAWLDDRNWDAAGRPQAPLSRVPQEPLSWVKATG